MAAFPALFGLLMAAVVTGQVVDITPEHAVIRPGGNLTVLCKVSYPIDSCRVTVGTTQYRLIPGNLDGDITYAGDGLNFGECGVLIKNIKEAWNGNISCTLPPQTGNIEISRFMRLVVARAPGEPHLITPNEPSFREGYGFMAQCVVPSGRPAAKITWYMNEEILLTGVHEPMTILEPGTDLVTVTQNVSRTLSVDDDTKMLRCKVEHEALDKPTEAKRQLIVYYPPKRLDPSATITIFGLKLGVEGKLNVTIRSNPEPRAQWTIGDLRLVAPQSTEALNALAPIPMENGYYNITLVLSTVTKEDVERSYYLQVGNDFGNEEFIVRISTMDEPAGVELDTGAIVGIVIGVLVVLIAIFLVVLAYATDRWCFAGRRRDSPRSSGESSDTESAVGGRERSRIAQLSARMRSVLPKAKDKVQATETQQDTEDKPLSDDKKGVVYAELALGERTATEKPPPPSTEYAEIVYNNQPKENKE